MKTKQKHFDQLGNEIPEPTTWEKIKHYTKITLIHLLILTAVVSAILYRGEVKAHQMTKDVLDKQIQSLEEQKVELQGLKAQ